MGSKVQGSGFRVQGSKVQASGFRVQGSRFRFRVQRFKVFKSEIRNQLIPKFLNY